MKKVSLIILLSVCSLAPALAQEFCRSILEAAQAEYEKDRFDDALKKLQNADRCDYRNVLLEERQALQDTIFRGIQKQKKEVEETLDQLRRTQYQKFVDNAEAYRKEHRYAEALRAYREALLLYGAPAETRVIQASIITTQKEQTNFNFERNRDIGLVLKEAGYCTGALRFLHDARQARPEDETVKKAIQECQR